MAGVSVLAHIRCVDVKIGTMPRYTEVLAHLPPETLAELFEYVPDVGFFVKDVEGRYVAVNRSMVDRAGLRKKSEMLRRRVREVYPAELAERYWEQDQQVLHAGKPVVNRLDLQWFPNRRTGWCLTTKLPIRNAAGDVTGLVGISRDLSEFRENSGLPAKLSAALELLETCFGERHSPSSLARVAELPPPQFARLIKRIFRVTPSQLITQTRIAAAARMLQETAEPVAAIAQACGFYDHSAFSRAFRAAAGMTPSEVRQREMVAAG